MNSEKIPCKPDGKPFSIFELQTINDFIRDELHIEPSSSESAKVRSFIIGNIVKKLQKEKEAEAMKLKLELLPKTLQEAVKKYNLSDRQIRSIQFSMIRTGEHITNISEESRQIVIKNVIQAIIEGKGTGQLAQDLFHEVTDTKENLNRDWYRVANYEMQLAHQSGFLAGCKPGEIIVIKSMPNACKFCRQLDGRKFTVRSQAPEVDYSTLKVGSKEYNKIAEIWDSSVWVNKQNIGRSRLLRKRLENGNLRMRAHHERYSPCVPLHQNCRCRYVKERLA